MEEPNLIMKAIVRSCIQIRFLEAALKTIQIAESSH